MREEINSVYLYDMSAKYYQKDQKNKSAGIVRVVAVVLILLSAGLRDTSGDVQFIRNYAIMQRIVWRSLGREGVVFQVESF